MSKIEQFLNDVFGEVRVLKDGDHLYFVAQDVAKALGYSKATDMTRNLLHLPKKISISTNGGFQKLIILNKEELHCLLSINRNLNLQRKKGFYSWLTGEEFVDVITVSSKESEFLSELEDSLKIFGLCGERQFSTGKYYVDYYISGLNLAVEYDEGSHSGYCEENERKRESEIMSKLYCKFVRVSDENSNAHNIAIVMRFILERIYPTLMEDIFKDVEKVEMLNEVVKNHRRKSYLH